MKFQNLLRLGLWTGSFLIVVALVGGVLWLLLAAAGDQGGSQGAKGVTLVACACLGLVLVALVVLLALAEINRPNADVPPSERPPVQDPPL